MLGSGVARLHRAGRTPKKGNTLQTTEKPQTSEGALADLRENVRRLDQGVRSIDDARRERDRSIVQAHASGVSRADIIASTGLSGTMVNRIVKDARDAAAL